MIKNGLDVARLNFSHGTHEEHGEVMKLVRSLAEKHGRPLAIIADLQGPRIRVGSLPADGLALVRGRDVTLALGDVYKEGGPIPMQHDISPYVKPGERIYLRDGRIEVKVEKVARRVIYGRVTAPGLLFKNQGINLPDTDLGGEIFTEKDEADLEFVAKQDVDYVALSFVQRAQDVIDLRERLKRLRSDMKIIVKVETAASIVNLEEIVAATDAVMVARGDLATETLPELVPAAQRRMVALARQYRIPVIVATQMLESMTQSPQPTRAEVSDVATAVLEGADAVMLSGETAAGLFPVEAVTIMRRVIEQTENDELARRALVPREFGRQVDANAVSAAAVVLAAQLPACVIVAETATGQTARNISSLRPAEPIVMVTHSARVAQQLALVWGGVPYYYAAPERATEHVIRQLRATGYAKSGDRVVVASGNQPGLPGGTDTVSVRVVR
jgi:pyruvate kinase